MLGDAERAADAVVDGVAKLQDGEKGRSACFTNYGFKSTSGITHTADLVQGHFGSFFLTGVIQR